MPRRKMLRNDQFRNLFLARSISMLGDRIVPVALAFAVLNEFGSASKLGLVLAAAMLPNVLLVLVGGAVADRIRPQQTMLLSDVVRMISQGATAALLMTGSAELWHLLILQAVYGAAQAFFNPASTAVVRFVVADDELQEANALLGLTRSASSVVGPAIAGALVATVGAGVALAVDAATFLLSALFLLPLRPPREAERARLPNLLPDLLEGWHEFTSRLWLWSSVAYFALFHVVYLSSRHVLGPLVAKDELGGAAAWGLILTVTGVGAVAGSFLALRLQPRRRLFVMIGGAILFAPELFLLGFAAPLWLIAGAAMVGGVTMSYTAALWETILQHHIPPRTLARVSAYDWMGSQIFYPAGLALMGPFAEAVGTRSALVSCAVVLVIALAVILTVPEIRHLEETQPEGVLAVGV